MTTFGIPDDRTPWDAPKKRRISWRAFRIPLLILIVPLAFIAFLMYRGMNRTVYIVNGTFEPYTVQIDGDAVTLPPFDHITHAVAEGAITLQFTALDGTAVQTNVDISTPFWTRAFRDDIFIINPDQSAILYWEQVGYYEHDPNVDKKFAEQYYAGNLLTHLVGVDYPFEPLPAELRIEREGETRRSVNLTHFDAASGFDVLRSELSTEHALQYARRQLIQYPNDESLLWTMYQRIGPEAILAEITNYLDDRPVVMYIHLLYQQARTRLDPEVDLTPDYESIRQEDPDNPVLQYLHASAINDRQECIRALEHIATSPDAPEDVKHDLAVYYLSRPDFTKGLASAERLNVENNLDRGNHIFEALVGLNRYDEALAANALLVETYEEDGELAAREIALLHRLGRTKEIPKRIAAVSMAYSDWQTQSGLEDTYFVELSRYWRAYLQAMEHAMNGDFSKAGQRLRQSESPYLRFVSAGFVDNADMLVSFTSSYEPDREDLFFAASVAAKNDHDSLDDWLKQLADELNLHVKLDPVTQWLREGYRAGESLDPQVALECWTTIGLKMRLLTLLGQLDPKNRSVYFDKARELYVDPSLTDVYLGAIIGAP